MSNMPFIHPSEPGIADDPDLGHGDSVNVQGIELGEASDDDVTSTIISAATVEAATENLHHQQEAAADES